MAVYHCRCAFLWFFLLHKQKKEQKVINILLSFLCLDTKKRNKRKIKDKRMGPPVCPAYAHEESLYSVISFFIEVIGRSCCCVLFATHGGAVFFVCIHYYC